MSNNTSSSFLIRFIWQGAVVLGLIAGAWVISQVLPIKGKPIANQPTTKTTTIAATVSSVQFFRLPQASDENPLALGAINAKVAAAKTEIIVTARQIAARSLLKNLQDRMARGVKVTALLSPDTNTGFATSKLALWLKQNRVTGVYQDMMNSASHMIVVDEATVIISDLPFSQGAYETNDPAARSNMLGYVYIIDDAKLAKELALGLKARALPQNKIL